MPGNPEEYNLNPVIRDEHLDDDLRDDVHDAGREPVAAVLESRNLRDANAAGDRQAAAHPNAADPGSDWNAAMRFNSEHRVTDQDQGRYPGSERVSHQNPYVADHKAILADVNPQAALDYHKGENLTYYADYARAEIAAAHVEAFRNISFPTMAEKVEAAAAIAKGLMEPVHHAIALQNAEDTRMTEAELATFHPADRNKYLEMTGQKTDFHPRELEGHDMLRIEASVQENLGKREINPIEGFNLAEAAIDQSQVSFKEALLMAAADPDKAAADAFAAMKGAAEARELLTQKIDYDSLRELAIEAVHDDEAAKTLNKLTETVVTLEFQRVSDAISSLEQTDPTAALTFKNLTNAQIHKVADNLAENLESGATKEDYDRIILQAQATADKHLEMVESFTDMQYAPLGPMTEDQYLEHRKETNNLIANGGIKDPALHQAAVDINDQLHPVEAVIAMANEPTEANSADPTQAYNDKSAYRQIIEDTMETWQYLDRLIHALIHVDQSKAAASPA